MKKYKITTLAGGCFWCTEAVFKKLKGVISVIPGYAGGNIKNPSYEEVSSGESGHVEAIQIEFDPEKITYSEILDVFWHIHDPTTLNRQGNDIGMQYRSIIFYHNIFQKKDAEKSLHDLIKSGKYKKKIVTEIIPFKNFYEAEDYHKNYFENHKGNIYCSYVIAPKIKKLEKDFAKFVR